MLRRRASTSTKSIRRSKPGWWRPKKIRWQSSPPPSFMKCRNIAHSVVKNINAAGIAERVDVAKLNAGLQSELSAKGLVFNTPDPAPFREALRKAGFYSEWKGKYGEEAWAILEKSVGKLS